MKLSFACPSQLQSVRSIFFIGVVDYFFSDFLNEVTLFLHQRNDTLIYSEISLLLVFVPNVSHNRAFF